MALLQPDWGPAEDPTLFQHLKAQLVLVGCLCHHIVQSSSQACVVGSDGETREFGIGEAGSMAQCLRCQGLSCSAGSSLQTSLGAIGNTIILSKSWAQFVSMSGVARAANRYSALPRLITSPVSSMRIHADLEYAGMSIGSEGTKARTSSRFKLQSVLTTRLRQW